MSLFERLILFPITSIARSPRIVPRNSTFAPSRLLGKEHPPQPPPVMNRDTRTSKCAVCVAQVSCDGLVALTE